MARTKLHFSDSSWILPPQIQSHCPLPSPALLQPRRPGSHPPKHRGGGGGEPQRHRRCPKIAPRTFKCRDRHHQRRAIHHPERTRKPQTKDHALCQAELASDHIGPHIPVIGSVLSPGSGSGGICRCFCPLVSRTRKARGGHSLSKGPRHVGCPLRVVRPFRRNDPASRRNEKHLMPAIPSFASPGVHHALTWLLDGSQQRRRDTVVAIEDDSGTPRLTPPPPCKQAPAPTARFRISPLGVAGCHRHCWLNRATVHLIILSLNCLSGPAGDVRLLR